jgi:hypothetical protein
MDLADFEDLLDLIRGEIQLLVERRYEQGSMASVQDKKMDVFEAVEKLRRRVEMY